MQNQRQTILCADHFYMSEEAMKILQSAGNVVWSESVDEAQMTEELARVNPKVLIAEYFKITRQEIYAAPNLRGIAVWGVGYDHIDVEAASEKGIYVVNTRGSNTESVAEHTFSLLINAARKLLRVDKFVREGKWHPRIFPPLPPELIGADLYKKTLGIVGLGNIGMRTARMAQGFNMRVLAYDPYANVEKAREAAVELVSLDNLLKEADFVAVHAALTKETRGLIGLKELEKMKPTAYLINTSRGAIIEEEALITVLKRKRIAGAALDVFSTEPINPDNSLLRFENVIVTPHIAGESQEALNETSLKVAQGAMRIMRDQVPENLVNESQLRGRGFLK